MTQVGVPPESNSGIRSQPTTSPSSEVNQPAGLVPNDYCYYDHSNFFSWITL